MYSQKLALALATAAFAAYSLVNIPPITIDTPTIVRQCENTEIFWHGGTGPFFLVIFKAGQATATDTFAGLPPNTDSLLWQVDIAAGFMASLRITDSEGNIAQSRLFLVGIGQNTCEVF
ncbi:hypothetical protein C8Q79DRAFT_1115501 [Trametes meyenii]|nr:hypothetical protein C8Q79DRAFT_1115501 [Trametes meyenii]